MKKLILTLVLLFLPFTFAYADITINSPTYLISGGTLNYYISPTRMTDTTAIIAFQDDGDSSKGKFVQATIPSAPTPTGYKNKLNGVIINKINGIIPAKINRI